MKGLLGLEFASTNANVRDFQSKTTMISIS
jgi:hypothetical protein